MPFASFALPTMQFASHTFFYIGIAFNFFWSNNRPLTKTKLMHFFVVKTNCIVGNVKVADSAILQNIDQEPNT